MTEKNINNNDFLIKNIEFIKCFNYINRISEINLYRLIENLLYGKISKNVETKYKKKIKDEGVEKFINSLRKSIQEEKPINLKIKRKNIKENMIENYVIKNEKNKEYLKELNLKIFLKQIPNKNIIIENGEIVNIIE